VFNIKDSILPNQTKPIPRSLLEGTCRWLDVATLALNSMVIEEFILCPRRISCYFTEHWQNACVCCHTTKRLTVRQIFKCESGLENDAFVLQIVLWSVLVKHDSHDLSKDPTGTASLQYCCMDKALYVFMIVRNGCRWIFCGTITSDHRARDQPAPGFWKKELINSYWVPWPCLTLQYWWSVWDSGWNT